VTGGSNRYRRRRRRIELGSIRAARLLAEAAAMKFDLLDKARDAGQPMPVRVVSR
jgi:hypothetical protein